MPSYRFCRPDDIPLLVHAVETCYRVHDPGEPPWTADSFRRGMREIDLWPSNSMVALDTAGEPVAVMIGTKRPDAVAVHRLGVRPDHLRQGHGLHLLTSLSQKLAVLGPDRLVAEVPDDRPAALACFAAAGYRSEATLVDWRRPAVAESGDGEALPEGLVEELTVADLDGARALPEGPATARRRTRRTLLQSADRLSAAAVLSPDRVEGWVVFQVAEEARWAGACGVAVAGSARTDSGKGSTGPGQAAAGVSAGREAKPPSPALAGPASRRPVVAVPLGPPQPESRERETVDGAADAALAGEPPTGTGAADPAIAGALSTSAVGCTLDLLALGAAEAADATLVLGVLFRWLAARHPRSPLVVPRVGPTELAPALLTALGFAPGRSWSFLAATAAPL